MLNQIDKLIFFLFSNNIRILLMIFKDARLRSLLYINWAVQAYEVLRNNYKSEVRRKNSWQFQYQNYNKFVSDDSGVNMIDGT